MQRTISNRIITAIFSNGDWQAKKMLKKALKTFWLEKEVLIPEMVKLTPVANSFCSLQACTLFWRNS